MSTAIVIVALSAMSICLSQSAQAQWREGPPLESPRWHHAAAARGDFVFAFGGRLRVGDKQRYAHGVGEFGLDYLDPSASHWRRAPAAPRHEGRAIRHIGHWVRDERGRNRLDGWRLEPTTSHTEVSYELPFGGADLQGRVFWFTRFGAPLHFDPRSRAWGQRSGALFHHFQNNLEPSYYEGTSTNWLRSGGATATDDRGRMYLVGGYGARRYVGPNTSQLRWKEKEIVAALEIYDPGSDTWIEAAPMKRPRQLLAASLGPDGKLYVFGGCNCFGSATYIVGNKESELASKRELEAQAHPVAITEVYDPVTNTWADRAPMPTPRLLLSAATGKDGRIHVIGGVPRWGGDSVALTEVYDPKTNHWSKGPPLRRPRASHASAVTGDGRIWVIGGTIGSAGLGDIPGYLAGERSGPTRSVEILATSATE